jgi:hypothetical protein
MHVSATRKCLVVIPLALLPSAAAVAGVGTYPTKLTGLVAASGNEKPAFGAAVALSGDGKTALVGAPKSVSGKGTATIFNYDGLVWQSGPTLTNSTCSLTTNMGSGVALSADGNTAFIGGYLDDCFAGIAAGMVFAFTRDEAGNWTAQGAPFRGTDAVMTAGQGYSVALSADGNTAMAGGPGDTVGQFAQAGAAWIFFRNFGVWAQQGPRLVANDLTASAAFGTSVALSADGNTAIAGGRSDSAGAGAAWVFTRSGGVWTQQGPKLTGNDVAGAAEQGTSVALSADGNTAIVGSPFDDNGAGAVRVFTRTGGVWSQEGPKLVGAGANGAANQGRSVALSADGNLALVGGSADAGGIGATWFFTRSNGTWTQSGAKRTGNMALAASAQGWSVALSTDGGTALVGAPGDNFQRGAAWAYTGVPCTMDVDGNQSIDALTDGLVILRAMLGLTGDAVTSGGAIGAGATRASWGAIRPYLNTNCGGNFGP